MKKKLIVLLGAVSFLFGSPVTLAYSNQIIPGGENIGIEINSNGVLVVGFYKVNGVFQKGSPSLKAGDVITKVNEKSIKTVEELISEIDKEIKDGKISLTYLRNKKEGKSTLTLENINGVYKTGLYVKDSMTGIGTLTYIDPETKVFGALGHEIVESATSKRIEVRTGLIFKASVTSIDKSVDGTPGGKNAKFFYNQKFGSVTKNTEVGIYGNYTASLPNKERLSVAKPSEVKVGKAVIRTVLQGDEIKEYEIYIDRVDENSSIKNIHFEIEDEALLKKTGGVVQGMSGSPIIQNGKICGAVTHVIIDNVKTGFGVFITTMLEEGDS